MHLLINNITILVVFTEAFPSKWSSLNVQPKEKKQERKGKEEGRVLTEKLVERAEQLHLFRNYVFFECPNCFLASGTKGLIIVLRGLGSIFPDSDQKMGRR